MKKRRGMVWLLLLTALAVSGMLFYDVATEQAVLTVETVTISRQTVNETVICAGTVTAADGVEVYPSVPCVAGEIAVEVGDRVKEGDVLLTVDRTATLAMAVGAGMTEAQSVMASAALPETVTAPSAGTVSAIGAVSGAMLGTDTPCVILSEGDGICISVAVRESLLPRVTVGQKVAVSGVAFTKGIYTGTVREIASSARTRVNGTTSETVVDAVVALDEGQADASLLLGLSAKAVITVATREDVLTVPYDCLAQDDSGECYVYRVKHEVAQRVYVTIEEELSGGAVITAGIDSGDVLVREPEQLEGECVKVKTEATT